MNTLSLRNVLVWVPVYILAFGQRNSNGQGGKAGKLHRVSEKRSPKILYILYIISVARKLPAAENVEHKKIVSLHGPWKMEGRSVKLLLKVEKLPETAKSLS